MAGLPMLTAHELQDRLMRGACSSVEIVQELLAAIQEVDGTIRGYLSVDAESALAQARTADAARAAGRSGPLLGIPVAIKDLLNVAGQTCGCASKMLQGYVSPYDATAVAMLRAAGAILLGRTNMDEFAMGSTTENSAFQVTRNPWSLDHVPGGSSGGSAAVVAAGEAVAALGSDTGGSIRQPAGFCGCVGLKPSYGRVSRYGLTAFASSLDQIGPLTRDVRDAARLLGVIAGPDARDSTTLPAPAEDYEAALSRSGGLRGMRLGLPREYFGGGLDAEVEAAVSGAVEECRRQGAVVVDISLPHTRYAIATYYIVACAEASANLSRFDGVRYGYRTAIAGDATDLYLRSRAEGFGSEVKRRILLGTYVLSSGYHDAYYLRAQKVRTLIRRDFDAAFGVCDAIVCPVAPTAAYKLGAAGGDPLKMYLGDIFTVTANLAGICGLSLPCGFTSAGLPVGLQFLGPALGEAQVLRAGQAYEEATAWHTRRAPHAAGNGLTGADGK
ncbi:MAG: Asp-tRNA(Asn)/Glu-tRNA(Gln) amidotransferase subunit GatA [bacterium]